MIRMAQKGDCLNLAALSVQVWLHTYAIDGISKKISKYALSTFTEDYFLSLLEKENYHILVYVREENLLGYIGIDTESIYETEKNGYEIETLYVQEHFQRQKIGQNLLIEVFNKFGKRCWLSTWIHNFKAIEFYKRFDFKEIGKIDFDLYGDSHENCVLGK